MYGLKKITGITSFLVCLFCINAMFMASVFADTETDIQNTIAKMTLSEKQAMCHGQGSMSGGGCPRLGIGGIRMCDGPLGAKRSKPSTGFGSGLIMAQTWNGDLQHNAGVVLGKETNAAGGDMLLGPGLNIMRDLVCGRAFEYHTEDPYLNGKITAKIVQGIQSQGVVATLKHFVCNNSEKKRERVQVLIADRTLREIYLPGFEMGIKEGGALAVMAACNYVNGIKCYGTPLMRSILKDEYGFKGMTLTDWSAVNENLTTEGAAMAGMDMSMPRAAKYANLADAVTSGKLPSSCLDDMVRRILRVAYFAGVPGWGPASPAGEKNTAANQAVARAVAEEGIVLLKNSDHLLPLDKNTVRTICLTGCNADQLHSKGGGSSGVAVPYEITPLSGLQNYGGLNVNHQPTPDGAVAAARTSDVTIVVTGRSHGRVETSPTTDAEGGDAENMAFPAAERDLIKAVSRVSKKVVVVFIGGPMEVRNWVDDVKAVLYCAYPGMEGGNALAKILFGEVNPSGKLTFTWPKRDADQPSYPSRNTSPVKYAEGVFVGYRGYEKNHVVPEFAFGHGLSYTTFQYQNLRFDRSSFQEADSVTASVDVTNTGTRPGKEIIQLYVAGKTASVPRPLKELKGFRKVSLNPHETKTVTFTLDKRSFAYWSTAGWYAEPGQYDIMVGNASDDIKLTKTITMNQTPGVTPPPAPAPGLPAYPTTSASTLMPVNSPYGGNRWPVPGTIEAENYDVGGEGFAYHSTTPNNAKNKYRKDNVTIQPTTDAGGGHSVQIKTKEWLKYSISTAYIDTYTMEIRVARAPAGSSRLHLESAGSDITGSMTVPSTGDWQAWTTIRKTGVPLNIIDNELKLVCDGDDVKVNWLRLTVEKPALPSSQR